MVFKKEKWTLKELIPSTNAKGVQKVIMASEGVLKKIEGYKNSFTHSITEKKFNELVDLWERYLLLAARASQFAQLKFAENSKDAAAGALEAKVRQTLSEHDNRLLWLKLGFARFPKKDINRLIDSCPNAAYFLKRLVATKDFLLSEKEEKIINLKNVNGVSALSTLYDILTTGFTYTFMGKELTQNELLSYVRSADAKTRELAYETLLKQFQKHETVFGELYRAIVSDWYSEYCELRGYPTPISVRNIANDIPDEVVEMLLSLAEKNQVLFQRYFKLKAMALGLKKLRRFDLYAPIGKLDKKISYSDACRLVLEAFRAFSPKFYLAARMLFERKHIHSAISVGKNQGAFCSGAVPNVGPFVLLNFTGDLRSVLTLAHELGHAVHYALAAEKQSIFHVDAPLPIAETASTFSELLLIESLKKEKPELVKSLLFQELDEAYASIGRQLEFVAFEKEAHELIKNGGSTDDLKMLYLNRLRKHFGPSVKVHKGFEIEWSYISHIFHTPF